MIIYEPRKENQHSLRLQSALEKLGVRATLGELETKTFQDGEVYHRFISPIQNEDVVLLGSMENDAQALELFDLACAASKLGAKTLSFVVPYFGYATMERAIKEGEVVKAKTRARLFSSVPLAHQGNNIFLLDLHVESLVHYFEGSIHSVHLSAVDLLVDEVKNELKKQNIKDFIIASADTGRAKTVQKLGQTLGCDCAFIVKKRDGDRVSAQAVGVDCKDKVVIIYDDMIRSGNTIVEAIKVYRNHGAKAVWVVCTHGVFTDPNSKIFYADHKFFTNSHSNHIRFRSYGTEAVVVDTMPIFAKALIERGIK